MLYICVSLLPEHKYKCQMRSEQMFSADEQKLFYHFEVQ